MTRSIAAMILSAGASRRMEQPKGLLTIGGTSFLKHIADVVTASDIRDTVIVLGADHDSIRNALGWFGGTVVVNHDWESGQLSSIVAGINALESGGHSGILLWPVDHPLIPASLITRMVHAYRESGSPIVVPVYRGRRGHPVILSRTVFDEVRSAPGTVGLRSVVHAHKEHICEVPTEEEGVVINIDTPDDYRRFVTARV
jgi:molybdenum cofactor cytidylyltransferase